MSRGAGTCADTGTNACAVTGTRTGSFAGPRRLATAFTSTGSFTSAGSGYGRTWRW